MTEEYRHIPVLLSETIQWLDIEPEDVICDCTLGGAGHSSEIVKQLGDEGILIGIDQDDAALKAAGKKLAKVKSKTTIIKLKGNFGDLDRLLQQASVPGVDGFLFDLGVSSPQLDVSDRGFSYKDEARLDMRMDPRKQTLTAQEVINNYNETDLTRIFDAYGDERWASRIAQFVIAARENSEIETTTELVEIIKAAIPASARRSGGHPARKTFQALRIEVNDELKVLERGLEAAIRWLNPGGRVAVISYHSLEDRIVKHIFRKHSEDMSLQLGLPPSNENMPILNVLTRKPIVSSSQELEINYRARSAKMRVAEKATTE